MKRLSDDPAVRLAECRGYSASVAVASSTADRFVDCKLAFDEAAERVKFSTWFLKFTLSDLVGGNNESAFIASTFRDVYWQGWLACAKSRAEVK